VVKTRVKKDNFSRIAAAMLPGWEVVNNYSKHCLGKIWICWDPGGVSIDPFDIHDQVLTCRVISKDIGDRWVLSVVYGSTHGPSRRNMIQELMMIKNVVGRSFWIIVGDFNVIRFPRINGGMKGFLAMRRSM
jgi:hypothetical protein